MTAVQDAPRYRAFISYSHNDKKCADWLHKALETYRLPARLVRGNGAHGAVPSRLTPIFRDRDELGAADDLGSVINAALASSGHLIVICSPSAARSRWVDQEIATFKRMHGEGRVLALIASGEPFASTGAGTEDQECFPRSLRIRYENGQPTDAPAEPIAADLRPGKDGRRLALLKLVAGLAGVGLDDLAQRDAQRRVRQLALLATGSVIGMLFATALALYANQQRIEADRQRILAQVQQQRAEKESAAATTAADFLIDTFALTNPETENPRTITAITILNRGAARAQAELVGQPALQARLAATLGGAYSALGLYPEAERVMQASEPAIRQAGVDGAYALLRMADISRLRGDSLRALALVKRADQLLSQGSVDHARLRGIAAVTEARVFAGRQDVRRSLAAFRRGVAAFAQAKDARPDDTIKAMLEMGYVLAADGQFAAADAALLRAMEIARKQLGSNHRLTASIQVALAENAFQQGKYDLAAERLGSAPAILRGIVDPDNPILADTILMQGQIQLGQKRFGSAARSLEQASQIYRRAFGKPHYLVGVAEVYLALARAGQGDLADSLDAFTRAKMQYDAYYGELHANHGDLLVNRATVLAKFGRRREAQSDCAEGLGVLRKTLGANASYTKTMAETCAKL